MAYVCVVLKQHEVHHAHDHVFPKKGAHFKTVRKPKLYPMQINTFIMFSLFSALQRCSLNEFVRALACVYPEIKIVIGIYMPCRSQFWWALTWITNHVDASNFIKSTGIADKCLPKLLPLGSVKYKKRIMIS